ncbi:hypothetical protein E2C01_079491 [Portunus trituberculatus]|uniref:Uncharacterized protein n=1 Tax=Portunus trituberculatus TaxID=210409 RepID=A0A5B7ILN1_PORTR|nr:hypothetical protein [Portunus trituberculatus]
MVSVPSVLDKLSASSLVSPDLLQTSAQSPSSSANHQSDEDVSEENLDMSTDLQNRENSYGSGNNLYDIAVLCLVRT